MIEKKNKSAFQWLEFGFVDGQNNFCVRFEESNVSQSFGKLQGYDLEESRERK